MNFTPDNESRDLAPTLRGEACISSEFAPSASGGPNASVAVPAIPDHQLLRCIGQGSYGEVWLARNVLGDYRAVKVVYRRTFESARPFDREFEGIKKFEPISRSHESQVQILHVGRASDDSCFYYIMELADDAGAEVQSSKSKVQSHPNAPSPTLDVGHETLDWHNYIPKTLRSEIQRRGRLPFEDCLEIALKLACAVGHLHQHGLVHRDIKPSNIIFVNGIPKLADIGLVAKADATLSFVGTEGFLPPEGPGKPQADIYSLGKVLYEISTGRDRQDFPELPTDLRAVSERERLVEFNEIILKACEPRLDRRYESAEAMHADLVLLQAGKSLKRLRTMERRFRELTRIAALLTILGVVVTAGLFYQRRQTKIVTDLANREAAQRRELRRNLYVADMKVAQLALEEGNRGLAVDLVNKYLCQSEQEDLRGFEWRYLWKLCQGREQFTLPGHSNRVFALAFAPDGRTLFSGSSDETEGTTVKVWDLASRRELGAHRSDTGFVSSLAISTDGNALFIAGDRGVAVRDGSSFATERRLPGAIGPLALSPDGRTLVTGGTNGVIIWDTANWIPLHTLPQAYGSAFAFSLDGTILALALGASGRTEVKLWNVSSLKANGFRVPPMAILQRGTNNFDGGLFGGGLTGLAFSRDGQTLATAKYADLVWIWDVKTGDSLGNTQPGSRVTGMVFLPDDKTLVTSSWEQDFRVWDTSNRTNIISVGVIPAHLREVWSLALSADGKTLASGSKDGTIKLWSSDVFQERPGLHDQIAGQKTDQIAFAQEGRTILTMTENSALALWKADTLEPLVFRQLPQDWKSAVISPQGSQLAVGLNNGAVQIWNVSTTEKMPVLSTELLPPQSNSPEPHFTWSAAGRHLAAAFRGDIYAFDTVQGQLIRKVAHPARPPYSIALSPDGGILAVGLDRILELWDLTTGVRLSTWVGHKEWTLELAFSPDAKTLASASGDNTAKLWHVPSGTIKADLTSHKLAVSRLAFSPDGRTLATLGVDAFKLWNVQTGQELMTLERFSILVPMWPNTGRVAFSPDGAMLAIGYYSPPRIQFWRAPALAEIDAANQMKK